jgi:allantoicase
MTPAQLIALQALTVGDKPFYTTYAQRCVYAALVMEGYARCYVKEDRSEWVRLATYEEREMHARHQMSAQAESLER